MFKKLGTGILLVLVLVFLGAGILIANSNGDAVVGYHR